MISESEKSITVELLKTGDRQTFLKRGLSEIKKPIEENEAAAAIGIPALAAYKLAKAVPHIAPTGSVAKLEGDKVYVTLGTKQNVSLGTQLIVFGSASVIRDPNSGEELGAERRELVRLKVSETHERFSIAILQGEAASPLKVGDMVEASLPTRPIALLPLRNAAGFETEATQKLGDEIIRHLVGRKLEVVERSRLNEVLTELGQQQSR